eukprot:300571-Chlamydomonas_euryale.AAC.21
MAGLATMTAGHPLLSAHRLSRSASLKGLLEPGRVARERCQMTRELLSRQHTLTTTPATRLPCSGGSALMLGIRVLHNAAALHVL